MSKPKVLSKRNLFDGFFTLKEEHLLYPSNYKQTFYTITPPSDAVVIVPLLENRRILCLREWRQAVSKTIYGLPGGFIDKGETEIEAAKRELLEECGAEAKSFKFLGSCYPYPGLSSQKASFFAAFDTNISGKTKRDEGEIMEPVELLLETIYTEARTEGSVDGHLLTALFLLEDLFRGF